MVALLSWLNMLPRYISNSSHINYSSADHAA